MTVAKQLKKKEERRKKKRIADRDGLAAWHPLISLANRDIEYIIAPGMACIIYTPKRLSINRWPSMLCRCHGRSTVCGA